MWSIGGRRALVREVLVLSNCEYVGDCWGRECTLALDEVEGACGGCILVTHVWRKSKKLIMALQLFI